MNSNEDQFYSSFPTAGPPDYPLSRPIRNSMFDRAYQQQQMMASRASQFGPPLRPNYETSVSLVEPSYESSSVPHTIRPDAWGPSASRKDKMIQNSSIHPVTVGKEQSSIDKALSKLTSTKVLFLTIGLILCGAPLAVMTTLYLKSSSSTAASTVQTVSTTTANAAILPTQCYVYTSITDSTRLYTYTGCCYYDNSLTTGWYRFSGTGGTQLVTTQLSTTGICGTSYPGWWNGTLPTTIGVTNIGNICFSTGSACSYSLSPISATNCNGYYVFYLIQTACCTYYRYCTTP